MAIKTAPNAPAMAFAAVTTNIKPNIMKIIIQSAITVTAVCLFTGCDTTGLSPREAAGASYPNYVFSLQSGSPGQQQKVTPPIRLAVVQIGEEAPPEAMLGKLAGHTTLIASEVSLPLPSDVPGPFYVARRNFEQPDYAGRIKTLCALARTSGADFVFLFGGNLDTWQENNALSIFDTTIIGGVVFPGTKIHVEGKGAGVLISTATCQPLLFVSSEAKDSVSSPDLLVNGKAMSLQIKVRDELVNQLTDQFLTKLADSTNR